MGGMDGTPDTARLVLLNGPPAAGKSTVAAAVLEQFGREGRLAVLEHDAFAEMGGAHLAAGVGATDVWAPALDAAVAAAKAYLGAGMAVLLVVNYGVERKSLLEGMLAPYQPRHVVILPPWGTNRGRVLGRTAVDHPPRRLGDISEEAHRQFHADLTAMARNGEFDDVITSARIRPATMAKRVARHLGVTDPGHATT
jgi:hypothetical protein